MRTGAGEKMSCARDVKIVRRRTGSSNITINGRKYLPINRKRKVEDWRRSSYHETKSREENFLVSKAGERYR